MERTLALLLVVGLAGPLDPAVRADASLAEARARATLHAAALGSDVGVVLRDGVRLRGKLSEVSETGFSLFVPVPKEERNGLGASAIKTHLSFEQVHRVEPSKPEWIHPERMSVIETGRKVEVLLLTGTRVSGRLDAVTQEELFLARGSGVTGYSFEDVAAVRKKDLSLPAKIGMGVAVGFVLFGLAAYAIVGAQAR